MNNDSNYNWFWKGIKRDDSIISGMQIHHNYIRPHQGLDGDTPALRAGIEIKSDNKWLTIIENASSRQLTNRRSYDNSR